MSSFQPHTYGHWKEANVTLKNKPDFALKLSLMLRSNVFLQWLTISLCFFSIKGNTIGEGTGIYPFVGLGGPLSACLEGEQAAGEAEKGPAGHSSAPCS